MIKTIKDSFLTINWNYVDWNLVFVWNALTISMLIIIITMRFPPCKQYFISKKGREFLDMGEHQKKQTTPTMGGLAFYAIFPLLYYFYAGNSSFWFIAFTSGLSGLVGALDDWFKINHGTGLSVKVKFTLQMFCALICGVFFYCSFPEQTYINFFGFHFHCGIYYILWIMWVIMATTHAVNLIDGIDGLAISQVGIMQIFSPLTLFGGFKLGFSCMWYIFFTFNRYPAKIFMGDVGAFFLGGYLASAFIAARCEILLVIVGIILVLNTMSVIIQTIWYKLYRTRFFSFTPYHHALEKKGWSENKICMVYGIVTLTSSIISLVLYKKYYI